MNLTFNQKPLIRYSLCALFLFVTVFGPLSQGNAKAGNFTFASMRLDNMNTSAVTSSTSPILIIAKIATTTTAANVVITFANSFTVSAVASAETVSTTGLPATYNGSAVVAWPSIANGSASGQVATFATTGGSALTPGSVYGFFITGGITNPSSAAQYLNTIAITGGDSTQVAVACISSDQITVSAVVPPTFTYALGGTTDSFTTNLSPSSVVLTTGQTVSIGTNAAQGWTAWVKSTGQKLHSNTSGASNDIPSVAAGSIQTLNPNTPNYALSLTGTHALGTGTVTIALAYAGSATTGGALTATYTQVASSNGTASNDVITLKELATISSITGAASDYLDTLTVVGAANF